MRTAIYVKDEKLLDYINSKGNKSKYICNLIKNDMDQNKPLTRDEVIDIIKNYTKNNPTDNNVDKIKNTLADMFDK
jgi:uncharacterized protein YpuA (DUF1002 family)